jgi:hypothetical protein
VTKVIVYNRDDCCKERVVGAKVVLKLDDNAVVCEAPLAAQADHYTLLVSPEACELKVGLH